MSHHKERHLMLFSKKDIKNKSCLYFITLAIFYSSYSLAGEELPSSDPIADICPPAPILKSQKSPEDDTLPPLTLDGGLALENTENIPLLTENPQLNLDLIRSILEFISPSNEQSLL